FGPRPTSPTRHRGEISKCWKGLAGASGWYGKRNYGWRLRVRGASALEFQLPEPGDCCNIELGGRAAQHELNAAIYFSQIAKLKRKSSCASHIGWQVV